MTVTLNTCQFDNSFTERLLGRTKKLIDQYFVLTPFVILLCPSPLSLKIGVNILHFQLDAKEISITS